MVGFARVAGVSLVLAGLALGGCGLRDAPPASETRVASGPEPVAEAPPVEAPREPAPIAPPVVKPELLQPAPAPPPPRTRGFGPDVPDPDHLERSEDADAEENP
jgi:hypothetical protein